MNIHLGMILIASIYLLYIYNAPTQTWSGNGQLAGLGISVLALLTIVISLMELLHV